MISNPYLLEHVSTTITENRFCLCFIQRWFLQFRISSGNKWSIITKLKWKMFCFAQKRAMNYISPKPNCSVASRERVIEIHADALLEANTQKKKNKPSTIGINYSTLWITSRIVVLKKKMFYVLINLNLHNF